MPTIAIVLCKYILAIALVRIVYLYDLNHCVNSLQKWTITCFNPRRLECGGAMQPQRKVTMVETTHAFVKLKQFKAAVSAEARRHKICRSPSRRYAHIEISRNGPLTQNISCVYCFSKVWWHELPPNSYRSLRTRRLAFDTCIIS